MAQIHLGSDELPESSTPSTEHLILNPVSLDNRFLHQGLIWCSKVAIWACSFKTLAIRTSAADGGVDHEELGALLVPEVDSARVV